MFYYSLSLLLLALSLEVGAAPQEAITRRHMITRRQTHDSDCSDEEYLQMTPDISPECAKRFSSTTSSYTDDFADSLREQFCDPTCSPSFINFIYTTCFQSDGLGPALAEYYVLFCGRNNGVPCYAFLAELDKFYDIFEKLGILCASALNGGETCSSGCTKALTTIRDNFGCCTNNFLNTTYARTGDPVNTAALSYGVWSTCGVKTPDFCPVDPVFRQFLSPESIPQGQDKRSKMYSVLDRLLNFLYTSVLVLQ